MTKLIPNVRMELDGKKLETVAFRCSYDLREALFAEAKYLGITPSKLAENIVAGFFQLNGKQGLQDLPFFLQGVLRLFQISVDMSADDKTKTPLDRQRVTKHASKVLDDLWSKWHEEHDQQEEIA